MQQTRSHKTIAPLRNVVSLDSLVRRLQKTPANLPRLGVMYGRSGLGKTWAASFAANEHDAYHVQVGFTWTQKFFCKAIMLEMGMIGPDDTPRESIPDLVARIARQLALSGRILIVDDAQYLVKKSMDEIVRDVYEASQSPIIMIGEESLPTALKRSERVHNRVLDWVQAQPCDIGDTKALCGIVCGELEIAKDLLEKVCLEVNGCARRIVANLARIKEFAEGHALQTIDAAVYTGRIDTGEPVKV